MFVIILCYCVFNSIAPENLNSSDEEVDDDSYSSDVDDSAGEIDSTRVSTIIIDSYDLIL